MPFKPTTASPESGERFILLDVFRGFALLGIFVVNIVIMNATFLNQDIYLSQFTGFWDQAAQRVLQLFFYTKFFPIFSLLFGLGISMQAIRMMEKQKYSYSFFGRRMLGLFIFGALHVLLLWSGDVVHIYALLGLMVPLFLRLSNRWILILSTLLLAYPFYDPLLEQLLNFLAVAPGNQLQAYDAELVRETVRNGGFLSNVQLRLAEYEANLPMLLGFLAPLAFSMFLLGLYLGKSQIQYELPKFISRIKWPMLILLLLTNIYRLLFLFEFPDHDFYRDAFLRPLLLKGMVVSDVYMGIFYLWLLGYVWKSGTLRRFLSPLQYAGRMALTNYIMQSFIGLLLFSSLGLALYEQLSPWQTLLTACLVFTLQVFYSKAWLSIFRYGPLEWLWRCFTYRRWLPIKREQIVVKA